ncbi:AsnC family transcriptional regulator [Tersicoccus phoenicis]|uniref:AsnC family transcriptional regulator n=1 Tax=Tersicoccus phoenicis TaxID=554083 RepID=A0A1R1L9H2_9MICC|nr:Lrp/AsnC family transcriptional regulator [Tersicoccus phoenicis]OMH24184.1 AsnC family transcriptional regulator [Tersicoccus phoenicis]
MMLVDSTDLRILRDMVSHPRRTAVAIASRLRLSRNTVQTRLGRLEEGGAFLPFARLVAPAALGYPLTAFMAVQVQQPELETIAEAFERIPEIVEAHGTTGTADLLVRVVGVDAEDLFRIHRAMLACRGVERIDTSISMHEIIPYRVLPLIDQRLARGGG